MDNETRRLVSQGASVLEVQEAAAKNGFRTIRYDGLKKVLLGLTTIEELDRVTAAEEGPDKKTRTASRKRQTAKA